MPGRRVWAVGAYSASLILIVTAAPLLAEDNPRQPGAAMEQPATSPDLDSSGTSPGGLGSTGWTGGSRSQSQPSVGSRALAGVEQGQAGDQTLMATGVDLNGPPTRFPASETPE